MHQQQQQQHQTYTDLLLKSYENHIAHRFTTSHSPIPTIATTLYSPAAMGLGVGVGMAPLSALQAGGLGPYAASVGLTSFQGHGPPAPPGSFQHLLASMTSAAAKAKHAHAQVHAHSHVPAPLHVHTSRSDQTTTPSPPASVASPRTPATPGANPPGNLSPVEQDRRSSSIAVLRMKAREYELKLQMGQKCNGIVY